MRDYSTFLRSKRRVSKPVGITVAGDDLPTGMFPFQSALTMWALRLGRAALFADTGLGKTVMQLAWGHHVSAHTGKPVLILAPLAVAAQTLREADHFGITASYARDGRLDPGITITNYEMMEHFDFAALGGIILDESSILKHHDSKTRGAIIESSRDVPFRLSCTATPSPNDFMELANQSEFLGVMTRSEMLSTFFVHDSGETQKWRLKRHGRKQFWEWMSSWAAVVRKPSDIGYADDGYDLPAMRIHEHVVTIENAIDGELFPRAAMTLTEQRQAARASLGNRVADCAAIVNRGGTWVVWCHLNDESSALAAAIDGAVEVRGSMAMADKESALEAFSRGATRVLVTKPSIAGFGMNWQHCSQMAFVGISHSFEQFYQATRRCWRFGQDREVNVHLFTSEGEGQVLASIKRKEQQHREMIGEMAGHMSEITTRAIGGDIVRHVATYAPGSVNGEGWSLHLGDCVDVWSEMEPESIDYTLFSPPFASLYTYSASNRDMGNCSGDDEFAEHFAHLIPLLYRASKPGRLASFHCMNLPTSKTHHGYIGLRDFRGDLIRMFQAHGWIFHSEVCIWKDPVTAMQRTKALGLLYKQLKKDSAMSRQGIADYLVTMRKPGDNPEPVTKTPEGFPVDRWQRYASPVWMDINATRVLQYRHARANDDERHICPLQLDVIERCVDLWTNEGDLVASPFMGIGSEGYVAVGRNRRFVGAELKPEYFEVARQNISHARQDLGGLFA